MISKKRKLDAFYITVPKILIIAGLKVFFHAILMKLKKQSLNVLIYLFECC